MKRPLIILGSSRSNGNTRKLIENTFSETPHELVDLNEYAIGYYSYDHKNRDDDFLGLIEKMNAFDRWVFATPVYWYSMSAVMKTFFDRMTDLIEIRKDLGDALKGKTLYLMSCSGSNDLPQGFDMPFENTADYLNMNYGGSMHGWQKNGVYSPEAQLEMERFIQKVTLPI